MINSNTIHHVRKELYAEVEELVEDNSHGYNDMSEFAREAIRLHLQQVVRPNIEIIVQNRIKGALYRRRFEEIFQ